MFSSKEVPTAKLIPILMQFGTYLKIGLDHYALLKSTGKEAGPDVVAAFIAAKMNGWDPKVNNKTILDPDTKMAAARFLAGIVINLTDI